MLPREALSLRELEVCQWAAGGKQVSDIAQILGITPRTVTFHLNCVVEKLGASSKKPGDILGSQAGTGAAQHRRGNGRIH